MSNKNSSTVRHASASQNGVLKFVLKVIGAVAVTAVASAATVTAIMIGNVTDNITTVKLEDNIATSERPNIGASDSEITILIVGSDVRENNPNSNSLNDVTMLLHIPKDRKNATIVSFPRDLIVPIPSCPSADGGRHSAMSAQPINVTLSYGGLPCTVLTVEALTGMEIPYAAMLTFNGVIQMSNAVGGVEVCVASPIRDPQSKLYLDPGTTVIQGEDALAFLRTRKGVGDGSDLGRIGMQQAFLSSLIRTVKSNDTLTDINKLYSLATAATKNITLSESMSGLDTMVSLALVLKDLDMDKISFVTYPGSTGSKQYPGKVVPNRQLGDELFAMIKNGETIIPVKDNTGVGTIVADPEKPATGGDSQGSQGGSVDGETAGSEPPASEPDGPTISNQIKGQTADVVTCAAGR